MNEKRLCEEKVRKNLKTIYIGRNFYFFEKATSTFDKAQEVPKENGTVICARMQTRGRGRLGRQWQSSMGGIYFSVILKPEIDFDKVNIMTLLCAVGVKRALSKHVKCKIKWPNDIVSDDGKKLCGILTKLEYCQDGSECYINVGIGINANTEYFCKDLKYATSIKLICGDEIDESILLCECLYEIERCCDIKNLSFIMEEYKKQSITLNSYVRVIYAHQNKSDTGKCIDIKSDGSLVILKDDGEIINVNSGEVSVRGIYGEKYV